MKILFTLVVVLLVEVVGFSQNEITTVNSNSTFIVQINGKEYVLSEGEELKLEPTASPIVFSVGLADYRKFDSGAVSFDYPSNYSMEIDSDIGYKNWIIDGVNFVIMYFEVDVKVEIDNYINEMVGQFGKDNCEILDTKMTVGDRELTGKRINVALVGQKLSLDFLKIEMSDHKSRFIAFQDTKDLDGEGSKESIATIKMLSNSISYK